MEQRQPGKNKNRSKQNNESKRAQQIVPKLSQPSRLLEAIHPARKAHQRKPMVLLQLQEASRGNQTNEAMAFAEISNHYS